MTSTFHYEELDPEDQKYFLEAYNSNEGYIKCNGYFLRTEFSKHADRMKNVDIRDDDIWLCVYPKSGSTWLSEMIWCVLKGVDNEDIKNNIHERCPFFEFVLFDNDSPLRFFPDSIEYIENMPSPRIIKTHLPFDLLPEKLRNFSTNAKIINIMRNPRDTFISMYYFVKLRKAPAAVKPLEEFLEMILKGNAPYGPFPDHIKGYLQHKNNPNVLFLEYEQMKKDLKSTIHKTCKFLEKDISENDVERLFHHLLFSNMKKNPAVNQEFLLSASQRSTKPEEHFMRRGVVGDWKEKLDPELLEKFIKWENEKLNGVHFTYSI